MDYFSRQCRTPAGLTVEPAGTREVHSLINDLLKEHGPFRDDVMAWAREEARLETHTMKKLHQRLIVTYSPKYALYQKMIRDRQCRTRTKDDRFRQYKKEPQKS